MSKANYVLKMTEDIDVHKNPVVRRLKKTVLIVLIILFVGSFLLGTNLFSALSLVTKIILIGLIFGVLFSNNKETRQFPIELHFYDDRIEIHRLEVHYSNGDVKREYYVFRYEHSPVCIYSNNTRFAKIKGMAHGAWYRYTKTGEVRKEPDRVRDMEGICYFRVSRSCNVYLPDMLRRYTPMKIEIEK